MALIFEITSGPLAGAKYPILEGIRIGRSSGEIIIADPKISGYHAQVEKDSTGQFFLCDRGSQAGLLISGKKTQKVLLAAGVRIQVGKTFLTVKEEAADQQLGENFNWRQALQNEIPQLIAEDQPDPNAVRPFEKPIRFEFIEGPLAEESFVVAFGPRKIGLKTFDIEIKDPTCPGVAFEIEQSEYGIKYTTANSTEVQLNERPITTDTLKSGDVIRIGHNALLVTLLDD